VQTSGTGLGFGAVVEELTGREVVVEIGTGVVVPAA